ncbi:hypothetical protein BLOT_002584 [Blomia tropicalis]|nr:hypothetical protein BLOT_002584 [Blomia tropicalis]
MGESAKGDNWLDTQQTNGKEMWPNSFNWAQNRNYKFSFAIYATTIKCFQSSTSRRKEGKGTEKERWGLFVQLLLEIGS